MLSFGEFPHVFSSLGIFLRSLRKFIKSLLVIKNSLRIIKNSLRIIKNDIQKSGSNGVPEQEWRYSGMGITVLSGGNGVAE